VGFAGSWSPEDRVLAFTVQDPDTGWDIWLLSERDGPKVEPLFRTTFQELSPCISPDGRWMAYLSDATGRSELYVRRFPEGGRTWQISNGGAEGPLWAPGGNALYYRRGDRLLMVPLTTAPELRPGKERDLVHPPLAQGMTWDIAPDGKRFVVVGRFTEGGTAAPNDPARAEAGVPEIRVVLDWSQALQRVPR